ncbi:glycosyltransferase family 2 protein [Amylibacter sp.]|jgi:glycosyltransferase involved in cell wall biosynthesis|nr:glycosyltransferase family 2 protein [Amylibacter sp.]
MIRDVSLIIPSKNANKNLFKLLRCIPDWDVIPNEIIIVDSSHDKLTIPKYFNIFVKNNNIKLSIIYGKNLYPGHARNIGINSSNNDLIAFLDTSTIPKRTWLSSGLEIVNTQNSEGVWGKTYYEADKFLTKIYRASTFGEQPIKTFPGSILKKNVFNKCGLFIQTTRAGEDGDWMSRSIVHGLNISIPYEFLNYGKLNELSTQQIIRKWFRNYSYSSKLPYSKVHRDFYYYGSSFLAVLVAFNWNAVLASWDSDSDLYIPNITKISILMLLISYTFIRGIFIPRRKGVSLKFIFPINFIFISFFSGMLDFVKVLAFVFAKFKKNL